MAKLFVEPGTRKAVLVDYHDADCRDVQAADGTAYLFSKEGTPERSLKGELVILEATAVCCDCICEEQMWVLVEEESSGE